MHFEACIALNGCVQLYIMYYMLVGRRSQASRILIGPLTKATIHHQIYSVQCAVA
jgi:hypothetical protein